LALTPGTRIGVLRLIDLIGRGGMGEVYRATDTSLGRQVAIKVLPEAFAQDAERLARFEREAKTDDVGTGRGTTADRLRRGG
jgi:serine/threonine protein kinase